MTGQLLFHLSLYVGATGSVSCGDAGTCPTGLPVVNAGSGELQQILAIVFGIFAAVSVLMIVIAGLRMVSAQGNSQEVGKARSTIVYAVAGLIICLIAEGIVGFVLDKFQ